MTINFPARRSGTHYQGLQDARKAMITRRSLLKLGAGSAAITWTCAPRWITVWARGSTPGRFRWPRGLAGTTTPGATSVKVRPSCTGSFPWAQVNMTRPR